MTLGEILALINDSNPGDWELLEVALGEDGGHRERLVWTIDPRLAIEYGRVHSDEFWERWLETIHRPDPEVRSRWVEVLLNGQPIYQHVGVSVDGGRGIIALPRPGEHTDELWVWEPRTDLDGLFRILNRGRDFDRYSPRDTMRIDRHP